MKIAVTKETYPGEKRAALIPADAAKLVKLGAEVLVEAGTGAGIHCSDDDYRNAGATVLADKASLIGQADIVLKLRKPSDADVTLMREGTICISYLEPFQNRDLLRQLADRKVSALCMELIPRSTRAQKMDALSSQASLAGYAAVILAAEWSGKILPMMSTPAGTINPSRVFIIGAGVAGLQAIATAKRLGARVDAFDTRPAVAEQVRSLGARFVEVDLGETGQTKDGYAKELTPEQLEIQRQAMAKQCAISDIVITTAQLFGKKAPIIVTKDMVAGMKPGSVIVDLAIEGGGNVDGAELGKAVDVNGVTILGFENLPGRVAVNASQMYSSNLYALIEEFWNKEEKCFRLKMEDDIIQRSLVTHDSQIVHEWFKAQ